MSIEDLDDRPATETITITAPDNLLNTRGASQRYLATDRASLGRLSNRSPGGGCRRSTRMTGEN